MLMGFSFPVAVTTDLQHKLGTKLLVNLAGNAFDCKTFTAVFLAMLVVLSRCEDSRHSAAACDVVERPLPPAKRASQVDVWTDSSSDSDA